MAPSFAPSAPPELFSRGVPVPRGRGRLAFEPAWDVPARLDVMTGWEAGAARALAREVHDSFADRAPGAADLDPADAGEAGGCLGHALRFAARARARGVRVGVVHGLLAPPGAPGRPHAWVRVALARGASLDLDPTSLEPVLASTHLPLALVDPEGDAREAGERWLALLGGGRRVVRGEAGPRGP